MSCSYADGLSPYDHKGLLGLPEQFDTSDKIEEKCKLLTQWILESRHVVFHTGAGISTAAGIPDFRGPNGVWTLEKQGVKPNINVAFNDDGYAKFIVSQNIDGLHLRSGLNRQSIAELHGNMFTEQCATCKRQFIRYSATTSVGQKQLGTTCPGSQISRRGCRGKLIDTILDWEASLPEDDLVMADYHSCVADLSIALGTTLQIVPSGNLPTFTKKYGGRLVIINLQPTKHDKKADLIIHSYVDEVLIKIMKCLQLDIPQYTEDLDPTKRKNIEIVEWNYLRVNVVDMKNMFNAHTKKFKQIKLEKKLKRKNEDEFKKEEKKCKDDHCEEMVKTEVVVVD
ncbi:hypothetical protein RI129_000441 [Pyrocoelia pectoralis]|uniref:protein acetyllysine N-acetyltransferase n=1 Tax=Pyrocoelia pectoralis TaxID=417401 RepID=A0AAN7ZQH7_9COLE